MDVEVKTAPPASDRRNWTTFIPRPGSSSGRPTSSPSVKRPSSSSGWLGGGRSFTSANTVPPASNTRSWTTFIPRPGSSSGTPTSSSSLRRPSSSSGWLGGGGRSFTSANTVPPTSHTRSWTTLIPRSGSSSDRPTSSPSVRRSSSSSGWLGGEGPSSTSANTAPLASNTRRWTTFIPRPGSSSGGPTSSSSLRRPSSSSGWLGGGGPNFKSAVFRRSSSGVTVVTSSMAEEPAVDLSRTLTYDNRSPPSSRPTTTRSSSLTFSLKSPQALDHQASQLIANAAERTGSLKSDQSKNVGSFGKSFTSMMGGLSSLSLSRTNTQEEDKERGRSVGKKTKRTKSVSQAPTDLDRDFNRSTSRARSHSPFSLRRFRTREPSPTPQAVPLGQSDAELSDTASVLPHSTAFTDDDSGDETVGTEAETTDYGSTSDEDIFDIITERNTESNALIPPAAIDPAVAVEIEDPDPVGEGVNVIVAPEPYFPSSLNMLGSMDRGKRNPRRRKSVKTHEPLPFQTSRPAFQRDRCTITITQGDPEAKRGTRRKRQYVVASDLSEESRYAVEWGIGTVVRDGDEMLIVTVVASESRVDPPIPNAADRATKLRSQQERQGRAYILVRQVTGLLQRTKLNVTVSCQAWHAKNERHMLLDIVDHVEPSMLIVGSRGLGQLNGILLGSTSHYLIQKCSVPVMVARRRLKRPPKKSAHLSTRRTHVSLAEAGIDRVAARVDQDVQVMREEIQKSDQRRIERRGSRDDGRFDQGNPVEEDDPEDEIDDDDLIGVKVAGD